jgi:hypothetical protein
MDELEQTIIRKQNATEIFLLECAFYCIIDNFVIIFGQLITTATITNGKVLKVTPLYC